MPMISVVVPVYNEVGTIERLCAELFRVLDSIPCRYTIVFVDDGGTDGTGEALDRLHERFVNRVTVLHLSRNFGHQAALTAGFDHAEGDAVICLDADMQHPPETIRELFACWQAGFEVVQAVRRPTPNIGYFKNLTAHLFYGMMNRLSTIHMEQGGCDFRLLSRRVADILRTDLRERERFVRGLTSWVGFRSCKVEFDAADRFAGESKYSIGKMVAFARTGLISFSKLPLRLAVIVGLGVSGISLLYGLYVVFAFLMYAAVVPGWASTVLVVTFLGGCQMLFLGLLGEYVATIFEEVKGRPLYLLADVRKAAAVEQQQKSASA